MGSEMCIRDRVDFDNNGFEIIGQHDIESEYMEAHVALVLFRLTVLILMSDGGQAADN